MGYVKRKGTKEARKIPADFDEIKSEFLNRVSNACQENSVTDDRMIINFDQTGTKFVPTSEWTMESQGSKQVPFKGNEDKREMTVLLSCNMKGEMLPGISSRKCTNRKLRRVPQGILTPNRKLRCTPATHSTLLTKTKTFCILAIFKVPPRCQ